jgi:hypothetical protein
VSDARPPGANPASSGVTVRPLARSGQDRVALQQEATLLDLVDRLLAKGVVIGGEVTISVADIDLIHLSLRALLTTSERAARSTRPQPRLPPRP